MTNIKLSVSGASVLAEVEGVLTSGMVGIPVTIICDESWDGLSKTLVCRSGIKCRKMPDVDEQTTVAHEVMIAGQNLYLGVEGRNGDGTLVMPTVWADCGRIEFGASADCDPSVDSILLVWKQIQNQMGDLEDLDTNDKSSLVAAINEAAGTGGGGLSAAARALLIAILRAAVYTSNQTTNITNLEAALKAGSDNGSEDTGSGDDGTDTVVYTITSVLTNVANSNARSTVTENASYSAVLTAADGYALDAVTVTMGGVDITDTVYSSGVVAIGAVTGNIIITATAIATGSGGEGDSGSNIVNLFDKDTMVTVGYFIGTAGTANANTSAKYATIPITGGKTYAMQRKTLSFANGSCGNITLLDADRNLLYRAVIDNSSTNDEGYYILWGTSNFSGGGLTISPDTAGKGAVFTTDEKCAYLQLTVAFNGNDCVDSFMVEEGDTCHDYVAYV